MKTTQREVKRTVSTILEHATQQEIADFLEVPIDMLNFSIYMTFRFDLLHKLLERKVIEVGVESVYRILIENSREAI